MGVTHPTVTAALEVNTTEDAVSDFP